MFCYYAKENNKKPCVTEKFVEKGAKISRKIITIKHIHWIKGHLKEVFIITNGK